MNKQKILITGSCGFILGNFLRRLVSEKKPYQIASLDRINSNVANSMYWNKNHSFNVADINDQHIMDSIFQIEQPDIVIHGAAETSIEESFKNPNIYLNTNIIGTQNIINSCLKFKIKKLIYLSSSDIYGSLTDQEPSAKETNKENPGSPYAISKMAAEQLIKTAASSSGLNYNIVRCSSSYGPRQNALKLIPKAIKSILQDTPIALYGNGLHIRDWAHVFDTCSAILTVMENGQNNEIYNISSNQEYANIEVIQNICNIMNKGHNLITFISDPRKVHDYRNAIDSSKIKDIGWKSSFKFKDGLKETIQWYLNNQWYFK